MSEIHKLEVVISASNEKLKRATREAQEATRKMTTTVNTELKKMRPPSLQNAIQGVKNYMKQLQMAAGIKVHTEDYKELEKDIQSAESAVDKLKQKMAGLDENKRYVPTQEFKDLEKSIQSSEGKLARLREKSVAMQSAGKSTAPTEAYKEVAAQLLDAQRRLAKMTDTSGTRRKSWSSSDVEETKKEVAYLSGELKELRKTGESAVPTQAFRNLTNEIAKAERQLQEYKAQREQMIASGANQQESEAWRRTSAEIAQAEARLQEYQTKKKQLETSGGDVKLSGAGVKGFGSKLFGGMGSVFRSVTSGIKSAGGAFAALIQRFQTGIPHINNAKKALNGIGRSSSGLGNNFRSLRRIVRALFLSFALMSGARGMKTGLQNLSQYSSSANNSLSQLRAGLSALQNGLAVAFEPILTYVAPALNTLIDYLLTACNAIAQFMAALTGQSTYTIAKRGTSDFAAGATAAGNAAGGAQKKAESLKRTLMGFDEINKLDDNDSSSGGGGGGGGAGGGAGFDTETVTSQYADLVEKIKKAWADADFTEIGTMIGEKLKAGLDNIKWDEIQATAAKVGKSVATLINGFVETSGLDDSVGKTVAGLLNTGITGSTAFLTNLHWDSIGSFIAGSLNSAIRDTDWSGAGAAVCTGINGVFTLADTWSGKFDFKAAGTAVKNAINSALNGINWKTAISAANNIGSGVASALNAVMTPETFKNVGKTVAGAINTTVSGAYSFLSEADFKQFGSSVASGINKAIQETNWENVGKTFGTGLQDALDFAESLIAGLTWGDVKNALQDLWKGIAESVDMGEVANIFFAALGVKLAANAAKALATDVLTSIGTGLMSSIGGALATAVGTVGLGPFALAIGAAIAGIFVVPKVAEWLSNVDWKAIGAKIGELFKNGVGKIEAVVKAGVELAKKGWTTVTGWLSGLGSAAAGVVTAGVSLVKSGWATVTGWLKNLGDVARGAVEAGVSLAKKGWTTVTGWMHTLGDAAKGLVEVGVSIINKAAEWWRDVKKWWNEATANKSLEAYVKVNPGSMGEGAETPEGDTINEYTVKINGDNSGLKQSTKESAEYLNKNLPNETSVDLNAVNNTYAGVSAANNQLAKIPKSISTAVSATVTGFVDSVRNKVLGGFRATISDTKNGLKPSKKTLSGFKARISSVTTTRSFTIGVKARITGVNPSNTRESLRASGGIYQSGRWRPITAAASGGAFSTGQMFLAREAGPELVGSIGRSTAVMNNNQIVASVSAGVYSAVCAAIGRMGSGKNSSPTINVYVGGKKITDVVVEEVNSRTMATGQCPILT